MAKGLWSIFGGSIVTGFFLAINIITGINIEPNDLIFNVLDTLVQTFLHTFQTLGANISLLNTIWNIVKIVFPIIGALFIIKYVLQTLSYGWRGIIVALIGFLGVMLLLLFKESILPFIGFILLVIGGQICHTSEGDAPPDFIKSNI